MKANHIDVRVRLKQRIHRLQQCIDDSITSKRARYYPFCKFCDKDIISINMTDHRYDCPIHSLDKQILYYNKLLLEIDK